MQIRLQVKSYHEVKQNNAVSSEKAKRFWGKKVGKRCRVVHTPQWSIKFFVALFPHSGTVHISARNILCRLSWTFRCQEKVDIAFNCQNLRTTINAFWPPLCKMKLVWLCRKIIVSYREVFMNENSTKLCKFEIVRSFNKQKIQMLWNQFSLTDREEVINHLAHYLRFIVVGVVVAGNFCNEKEKKHVNGGMQKWLQKSLNLFLSDETSDWLQLFCLKEQSLDRDVRCQCKYWNTDLCSSRSELALSGCTSIIFHPFFAVMTLPIMFLW
jgi:hypothetical protein